MAAKKFGGRPRQEPISSRERVHLGFRVTPEMKQRLEEAAAQKGRSQSQEAEMRLQRSFDREDLLSETLTLAYGRELAGLLMMLGATMQQAGRSAGFWLTFCRKNAVEVASRSLDQPYPYDQAVQAAVRLLEAARPPGDPAPPKTPGEVRIRNQIRAGSGGAFLNQIGIGAADEMIGAVCGSGITASLRAEGEKLRPLLGPIVKRLKGSRQ